MPAPEHYETGIQYTTASQRLTTACPRIDLSSNRKAHNTLSRVRQWLADNAKAEAISRGDDYNLTQFRTMSASTMSQADIDVAVMYLWDEQLHAMVMSQSNHMCFQALQH